MIMGEYDFILNPNQEQASGKLPSNFPGRTGTSMQQRIMVVAGGLVLLIIILVVLFGVLLKPNHGPVDELVAIYSTQSDMIELTETSFSNLRQTESKALAKGTAIVLQTDSQAILEQINKTGQKISETKFESYIDNTIRKDLESALSANKYDQVFIEEFQAKLGRYRTLLAEIYAKASTDGQRAAINQSYTNVSVILGIEEATDQ